MTEGETTDMAGHDIIVIGASMGGIEALTDLVSQLPKNLPAAIFVVQHTRAHTPSYMAQILNRAGLLEARMARDHEPLRHGIIYVAPPDHHLLVKRDQVRVVQGPRENKVRPAIDPLFRSAAANHGPRVIGIILSGLLDDGTAGLLAVKRCGGVAIVQNPKDAAYPDMPESALVNVDVDYCLPIAEMGAILERLVWESVGESPPIPEDIILEAEIAERVM
jgi:two-component system chemotaxis response regulator CheB